MADDKKSLGVHLRIPIEAVGSFMAELGERAEAWGFRVVQALSPNTPHPRATQAKVSSKAKAGDVRGRQRGRSERNTSQIAEEVFHKAGAGTVVTRGMVAKAFEDAGYNAKSAQTLLDRWVKAKKVQKVDPGKYKWVA